MKLLAIGKVAKDGTLIKGTKGVKVEFKETMDDIFGSETSSGYVVSLPEGLVPDDNYILQLTPELFGENGPDYTITTIGYRRQNRLGFQVFIWGDRGQGKLSKNPIMTVSSGWNFCIYDME